MKRASLCGALVLVFLAGCGHEERDGLAGDASAGDADGLLDIFVPIEDGTQPDSVTFDTNASDSTTTDGTEPGDAPDSTTAGDFGAECNEPDDCNSGWCIDGPDGAACTRTCIDSCPGGFACKNVSGAGADPAFICVSIAVRLCQPCRGNGDCSLTPGDASGNLCLDRGDEGSFCGLNCGENGWPCPGGYECKTIEGAPAGSGSQCVPADGGACECNGAGIALGLSTDCATSNELGRCAGERSCDADGLGICDATAPVAETCNGLDEDCDGQTDDGIDGSPCAIDNEFGSCQGTLSCDGGDETCEGNEPAPESCNGVDDDCDGETDEAAIGCREFYRDEDGDGVGSAESRCLCGPDAEADFTANDDGDCDDLDETSHPGADEVCDGSDNDCDERVDERDATGCESHYYDGDGDGFGSDEARCQCVPDEATKFTTLVKGDCNDNQPAIHPGGTESCNGLDDDCDQIPDPPGAQGCTNFAYDGDSDGFGILANTQCLCSSSGKYTSARLDEDCDDNNPLVNQNGIELCNGLDDDCDGTEDETFGDFDDDGLANCVDPDNDNDGDPNETDCKPYDDAIYGWATEICDSKDNDCDGTTDVEDSEGCTPFFLDTDGDGFGVDNARCLCAGTALHTAAMAGDCLDSNPTVNPDAAEVCDGLDNDCDLLADAEGTTGCVSYYLDNDQDGWGQAGTARCLCGPSGSHSAPASPDCDDTLASRSPGQAEICDGIDNDCDTQVDEGSGDFDGDQISDCVDPDDDNDGDPDTSDCAPLNAAIKHGAVESCDGSDNDCEGGVDEEGATGCVTWYFDNDNDGYGVSNNSKCLCGATGKYSSRSSNDCNDSVGVIHPGAPEICNSVDDNCDNSTDPQSSGGCTTYYLDQDGDGYGRSTNRCLCAPDTVGGYDVTNTLDCYDNNSAAKPGQLGWFGSDRGDGSFDYNCDNTWTHLYGGHGECFDGCGENTGWAGSDPGCGNSATWFDHCYFDFFECGIYCCNVAFSRQQICH